MSGGKPAIGVAVLLVVTAIALRGHVPGVAPAPAPRPEPPPGSDPLTTAFIVGLLLASIAVIVLAVTVRLRGRIGGHATPATRPDWLRNAEAPHWRRTAAIVFVAVIACLIAALTIGQFGGGVPSAPSVPQTPEAHPPSAVDPGPTEPPRSLPPVNDGHLLDYLFGATTVLVVVLIAGTVIATRMRHVPGSAPSSAAGDDDQPSSDASTPLARAAEVGLAEVEDPSREPRKAIIACYAAMERELANVPDAMPQDFDTASEVLARAVDHHALGPDSATRLVELFDEARFSPHVMGERHRDLAVEVLQRVLGELRSRA